ncbi:hypothetical protein Tco_0189010 [Tanacetum coccineum]
MNYMPQPMQNLKDSSDPTTAMNKALALMAKAFKFNTIPTNNNQISSLISRNSQISQPAMNTIQDIKMQMVDDNVGNQLSILSEIANQYGNRNVVTALAKGNGNGINEDTLQQASTSGTQSDNALVYDSDRSTEIKRLQAQLGDLNGKSSDTRCASNTLDPVYQKLKDENVSLEFQV